MNPDVSGSMLLRMATTHGAIGFGLNQGVGDLAIGAPAKLTRIENLPAGASGSYSAILSAKSRARAFPIENTIV
jgi:cytosine/adenosine deaminase-related metal-dependent hydrolase